MYSTLIIKFLSLSTDVYGQEVASRGFAHDLRIDESKIQNTNVSYIEVFKWAIKIIIKRDVPKDYVGGIYDRVDPNV